MKHLIIDTYANKTLNIDVTDEWNLKQFYSDSFILEDINKENYFKLSSIKMIKGVDDVQKMNDLFNYKIRKSIKQFHSYTNDLSVESFDSSSFRALQYNFSNKRNRIQGGSYTFFEMSKTYLMIVSTKTSFNNDKSKSFSMSKEIISTFSVL